MSSRPRPCSTSSSHHGSRTARASLSFGTRITIQTGRGSRGSRSDGTRITRITIQTGRGSRGSRFRRDADRAGSRFGRDADHAGSRFRRDADRADHDSDGTRIARITIQTGRGSRGSRFRRDADHADHDSDGTRIARITIQTGRGSRGSRSHGTRITRITIRRDADRADHIGGSARRASQVLEKHLVVGRPGRHRGNTRPARGRARQIVNPRDPRPVQRSA